MDRRLPVVVLSPIRPQLFGNGLAMRVAQVVEAAAADRALVVAVVPIAGEPPAAGRRVSGAQLIQIDPGDGYDRKAWVRLLAQRAWRERLATAGELPMAARAAPPTLADAVVGALGDRPGWAVHVVRAALAPLGVAVAELLGAPCLTLDLDDDDETLLGALGDEAEAAAYRRLLTAFLGRFDGIWLAAEREASAVASRFGVRTSALPNSVRVPAEVQRAAASPPDLLFVGNLIYPPNIDAARTLVEHVLPAARRRSGRPLTATLAGEHGRNPGVTALGRHRGVRIAGFVADLAPLYARATACVVPLAHGAGTRIKLLEAFAHGVPVVATPAAHAGLAVDPGTHLLTGETAQELGHQVAALIGDPARAARIATAARRFVERHHAEAVVARRVRALLDAAAAPEPQPGAPAAMRRSTEDRSPG